MCVCGGRPCRDKREDLSPARCFSIYARICTSCAEREEKKKRAPRPAGSASKTSGPRPDVCSAPVPYTLFTSRRPSWKPVYMCVYIVKRTENPGPCTKGIDVRAAIYSCTHARTHARTGNRPRRRRSSPHTVCI